MLFRSTILFSVLISSAVASLNPLQTMSTCAASDGSACTQEPHLSIFDFSAESIRGEPIQLASFRGKKAFLIVNVACQ